MTALYPSSPRLHCGLFITAGHVHSMDILSLTLFHLAAEPCVVVAVMALTPPHTHTHTGSPTPLHCITLFSPPSLFACPYLFSLACVSLSLSLAMFSSTYALCFSLEERRERERERDQHISSPDARSRLCKCRKRSALPSLFSSPLHHLTLLLFLHRHGLYFLLPALHGLSQLQV